MPTRFPSGVSSYGIPVFGGLDIPANATVLFVDSGHASASNGNPGTDPALPLATIAGAISLTAANNGDHIMVMPGHAETVTAVITMSVAGVTIWGWGYGRAKPAITISGAIDGITVTAANCHIHNLRLIGASASVTAHINVAAADLLVTQCQFDQPETPLWSITVASGNRGHFKDCKWLGTADGPDGAFDVESSTSDDFIIEDCFFNYVTLGMDLAVFRANADTASGWIIKNCVAIGLDGAAQFLDFNSSAALNEGIIVDSSWSHRAAATVTTIDLGGMGTARVAAVDGAQRAAILIPGTSSS